MKSEGTQKWVSIVHFFSHSVKRTARSGKGWKGKRRPVRAQQGRQFFAVGADENWKRWLLGLGRSHRFKSNIQRKAQFQNAPLIDADKGCAVDMAGFRMFGLNQHRVAVARRLKESHEVFARGVFFPHASG